jgi:hypothetical protein
VLFKILCEQKILYCFVKLMAHMLAFNSFFGNKFYCLKWDSNKMKLGFVGIVLNEINGPVMLMVRKQKWWFMLDFCQSM